MIEEPEQDDKHLVVKGECGVICGSIMEVSKMNKKILDEDCSFKFNILEFKIFQKR